MSLVSDTQILASIAALSNRVSALESSMKQQYLINNQLNQAIDYAEGQIRQTNEAVINLQSSVDLVWKSIPSGRDLSTRITALETTVAPGGQLYEEIRGAFDKAFNTDIFTLNAVLDIARYTQTPIEPHIETGLDDLVSRGAIKQTTMEAFLKTNPPTAGPYTPAGGGTDSGGGFWENLKSGLAGAGIGSLIAIGAVAIILVGKKI